MPPDDKDDDWEPTPVGVPIPRVTPPMGVPARAPTSGGEYSSSPKKSSASARAAMAEIRSLRAELTSHSQTDQLQLARIHEKLEGQDEMLTNIRIEQAKMSTGMEQMTAELRHGREIQKIKIEGEITSRAEEQKTEREKMSSRTKVLLALIAVASTLAGVLGKWLVG